MLLLLQQRYPALDVQLLSPLAEGADQLAAEVAIDMGIPLIVPLPMAIPDYLEDFTTDSSVDRFHELCEAATELLVLSASTKGTDRAQRYAELGIFLASHCHVLLAIWDGKDSDKLGGTAQTVRFHHDDIMPGYAGKSGVSRQMLIDDESDLVFHIVCSRDRPDGSVAEGLQTLDWCWFTKDQDEPRSKQLPPSHDGVLCRANEFSYDAQRFAPQTIAQSVSLLSLTGAALEINGLQQIDATYRSADFLAIHYQRKSLRTLRATHTLALTMGVLFILYSDIANRQLLLYLFLVCFGAATVIQATSVRRGWFRKYLDYRTLAEGLRVQFYWAMAGISGRDLENYSHDNFLQQQDPEVGWIRNAMRVAGTVADASPRQHNSALDTTIDEWIGDQDKGQLDYYTHKALERARHRSITEALGKISLFASAAVVVALLVAGAWIAGAFDRSHAGVDGYHVATVCGAAWLCARHRRERVDQTVRVHAANFRQCAQASRICPGR